MSSSGAGKGLRVPEFDGKEANYQVWWTRFYAVACVYKFEAALQDTPEEAMPEAMSTTLKDTTDVEKAAKKLAEEAVHRNSMAIANLTIAMTTPTTMTIVYKSHSEKWPNGLASDVVKALKKKYCPEDVTALVELRTKLSAVQMKNHERPSAMFERLSQIRSQYTTATRKVDEVDLLAAAMKAAPPMYASVITVSQTTKGEEFDLETMEETMDIFF